MCVLNTSDFLNSTREATTMLKAVQGRLKEALTAPDTDYLASGGAGGGGGAAAAVSEKLIEAVRVCACVGVCMLRGVATRLRSLHGRADCPAA